MKGGIHPKFVVCKVSCACGNEFETVSLQETMRVDICSNCHPFYTGKQKFVDTAGRVQKFEQRFKWDDKEALAKAKLKTAAQKKKMKIQKIGKIKKKEEAAEEAKPAKVVKIDKPEGEKKSE